MRRRPFFSLVTVVLFAFCAATPRIVWGCPYCTAQSQTLSEELQTMDAAIIAKMVEPPAKPDPNSKEFVVSTAVFEILEVLKGDSIVKPGQRITAIFYSEPAPNKEYLLLGVNVVPDAKPKKSSDQAEQPKAAAEEADTSVVAPAIKKTEPALPSGARMTWATPIVVSETVKEYLHELPKQPKQGLERLAFFHKYLQHKEELLARDAFDEFARAPYPTVQELKPQMNREQLWAWIRDPEMQTFRKRLYLTMLGVCGTEEDVPELEKLLKSSDRVQRTALDAMIGAYLTLKGESGVDLIEDLFLKAPKDDGYSDMYSTIMSLRILAEEIKTVPQPRIIQAFRVVLDHPKFADLVIPDLARYEDWDVMDRLVGMYRDADPKTSFVRVPIVNFVRACPLPEAEKAMETLKEIDPDSVRRATTIFPIGPRPGDSKKSKPESSYFTPGEDGLDAEPSLTESDPPAPVLAAAGELNERPLRDPAVRPASAEIAAEITENSASPVPSGNVSTRRRVIATNAGVAPAKALAKNSSAAPNRWLAPGVTWAVGLVLFAAQCWLLGGRSGAPAGEPAS